ncbi:serine hydrolase domain-containing protein [Streptomyces sp. NPDC014006]|uniref:serine hydrolase domain-containing protein n=1 Tax=Streptomyces sp. NPDC014006 TaxID=3364870 RepID=UPI0036F6B5F0
MNGEHRTRWPDVAAVDESPAGARRAVPGDEDRVRERLAAAVDAVDAPDAVFALSRNGHRVVHSGGHRTGPTAREELRYEIGSASKTFTGLLLAELIQRGALTGNEPAAACLAPGRATHTGGITLAHLITHTSGLPALPRDFFPRALPAWRTQPYARYPAERVVEAFLRARPRHRSGSRWHYSDFGVAVLGHALAAATGASWEDLVGAHVLGPLALHDTALRAGSPDTDAVGYTKDAWTLVPAFDPGGFQAAGAVRAAPHDLLTFLEAHLDPAGSPLSAALEAVRVPVLRRGLGHRHTHTLTWFRHPTHGGPMYFHGGATLGQQAFLGFRPDTGTALAAVCTRRFRSGDPFVATAYALLADDEI